MWEKQKNVHWTFFFYITDNKLIKLWIFIRLLGKEWNLSSIFQGKTVGKCKI